MTKQEKKLDELYELIADIEIAMMTTRRPDGRLVSRPMATQKPQPDADLWFVTDRDTHKVDEIEADPNVNLAYYDSGTREWVSVSGRARISNDRARIRELYAPDWRMYFEDEGGEKNGGPDDPRLRLVQVDVDSVIYAKKTSSRPVALFELAKGFVTGEQPDLLRMEELDEAETRR
ncbi:MAG TPA: pyridoxamine 5'-phosphate oxidase family protein [Longimicrobiales bacterium]|nr:pyridoxamine 5'-phosphate oxidase family protein [Longimicrobiales bacterium]